jgi:Tfp pilus assembly protein PilF
MSNEEVEMFYEQAMSYLGQGESKKAIEFFNKALKIDEMYLPAWNDKGVSRE